MYTIQVLRVSLGTSPEISAMNTSFYHYFPKHDNHCVHYYTIRMVLIFFRDRLVYVHRFSFATRAYCRTGKGLVGVCWQDRLRTRWDTLA